MISAYDHGQNAAQRGKHIQACPFDTGTSEWRAWRRGYVEDVSSSNVSSSVIETVRR
jgi:hypothetical protein